MSRREPFQNEEPEKPQFGDHHTSPDREIPCPDDLDLSACVRHDRYALFDTKLGELVRAASAPPPWRDEWMRVSNGGFVKPNDPFNNGTPEDRLALWKMVRASGDVPADAAFYMVADQVRFLAEIRVAELMEQLDAKIDALYAEAGLADWRAQMARDGEDHLAFADRCPEEWDRVYHDELRRQGEGAIADLYRRDREEFEVRIAEGVKYFAPHPVGHTEPTTPKVETPGWVSELVRDLGDSGCILPVRPGPMSLTFDWASEGGYDSVTVAVEFAQFVGGPSDGRTFARPFRFDLKPLTSTLDQVTGFGWEPFGMVSTPYPSHVWVTGAYHGHPLFLRVLSAPEDDTTEPDLLTDV